VVDNVQYRLALLLPQSRMLLACRDGKGGLMLPSADVQAWARPAQQLVQLLKEKWNIESVLLNIFAENDSQPLLAALEVRTDGWQYEKEGFLCSVYSDLGQLVPIVAERDFLTAILEDRSPEEPFSRLGWIDEARKWIADALPERHLLFSEDVRQLNGGGRFALVRFATLEQRAYWLKATGEPNVREFAITTTLAQHFAEFLPPLVASRADWNAWVMEDSGIPLSSSLTCSNSIQASRSLGALQLETVHFANNLLLLGCIDARLGTLQSDSKYLFEYLEQVLEQQTSTKAPRIERSRLHELRSIVERAFCAMESLQIPDSLVHIDINPGNVLINSTRCVFTDWAEAGVGNPFLTFQIFTSALTQNPLTHGWIESIKAAYRKEWVRALSLSQIDSAFALAPILAIVSYFYGRGSWLQSERRNDPHVQSYSRALARHMDRAARVPALTEALCR
jgi:hypothetical protein